MPTTEETIVKKEVQRFQTALDYTVQNSGSLESLFDVLEMNNMSMTEDVQPGTELQAPVVDTKVTSFYENSVNDVTTNLRETDRLGGIGRMQIGSSFKVS